MISRVQLRILANCSSRALPKNHAFLNSLTDCKYGEWVLSHIGEEAKLGGITKPVLASEVDGEHAIAARRFVVEQGVKQDGSPKLRACDDMSANETNSFAHNLENPRNENLDDLENSARYFHQVSSLRDP